MNEARKEIAQIDLPPKNCVILMEEKIIIECALMKLNEAYKIEACTF